MALGRWPNERVAWLLAGVVESPRLALLVTGLSPYLPQGFPEQAREENGCLRGPDGLQQAGQKGQFPLDLEFLAGLVLCGFVYWGGAAWIGRR
jgi:hypothetical protein